MKRDMDLIRRLLLLVEEKKTGFSISNEDRDEEIRVMEHMGLLFQEGLVEGSVIRGANALPARCSISQQGLTMEGHDFLDSIRDDKVWSNVKGKLQTVGGGATLAIIKDLSVSYLKRALDLD